MNVTKIEENRKKRIDSNLFVLTIMDAVSAPVLTHSAAWKDAIPQRLINIITLGRLKATMRHEELATYPEVCAFIMTRSFDAPMGSDWTDIYTHVSCTVCEEYWGEDHWEQVKAPRQLTDYQEKYLLRPLRQWIFKKRRDVVRGRIKATEAGISFSTIQQVEYNGLDGQLQTV